MNQDIWILQARMKELGDICSILEGMDEHYGMQLQGGMEGVLWKSEAMVEALTILNRRKIELLGELERAEQAFYEWAERENLS